MANKENKIDKVIDEVLESERVQQAGRFIKKVIFVGIGLIILLYITLYMEHMGIF
jgi:hypothetical protein